MKARWGLSFGLVGGLLAAGVLWLIASPPRGAPVTLAPAPTPAPITVHVTGAVRKPGVYRLPSDARTADAIRAAGGLEAGAYEAAINLAARLNDGDQVRVPAQPTGAEGPVRRNPLLPAGTPGPASRLVLVDINSATQAELESLPGVGPVTARKIIEHRRAHGPFLALAEIQRVSGIGPATFERIKDLITAGPPP